MDNTIHINPKPGSGRKAGKIAGVAIGIVIILVIIANCFTVVPGGSTGVVVTLGKISDTVLQEGLHFKVPFVQQINKISNKIQVVEVDAAAVSKDLQTVSSTIAVNFRIGYESSANVFKNIGAHYDQVVLLPAVQESMKSVSAKYTAEELITKRAQVGQEIKEALENKVGSYGIVIENFNIVNFDFTDEFNKAIEAKQVAEQNLIKTKTEQEQAIVVAEANAKQQIIAAQAEAEAIAAKAKAQAEANNLISQSLNPNLIEYEKVNKWDGQLPQVSGSSSPIIDMRGSTSAQNSTANSGSETTGQ